MDRDLEKILSENEMSVYTLIKEKGQVTIKDIQENCGEKAVGSIGRLVREELIDKKKVKMGEGYGMKMQKVYVLKENS